MTNIVWKFCFCSVHFQWWFKFQEKMPLWLKKFSYVKKLPISNSESFLESIFGLNEICKILQKFEGEWADGQNKKSLISNFAGF